MEVKLCMMSSDSLPLGYFWDAGKFVFILSKFQKSQMGFEPTTQCGSSQSPQFHPCSPQSPQQLSGQGIRLDHGGLWVQIPSEVSPRMYVISSCCCFTIVNSFLSYVNLLFEFQIGDGTNLVLVFSGALLDAAEELLRMVKNGIQLCKVLFQ